jgi:hypothetical protein
MHTPETNPNAGRYWLAALGILLACAGALFTLGLWHAWQKAEETRRWTPQPCRIISSKVISERPTPNSNTKHRVEIRYSYTFAGQALIGDHIKRVDSATAHEDNAKEKLETYPVGFETTCFVNPAHPQEAVLKHSTRAPLYSIWFPLLFVVGGLKMAWDAIFKKRLIA